MTVEVASGRFVFERRAGFVLPRPIPCKNDSSSEIAASIVLSGSWIFSPLPALLAGRLGSGAGGRGAGKSVESVADSEVAVLVPGPDPLTF